MVESHPLELSEEPALVALRTHHQRGAPELVDLDLAVRHPAQLNAMPTDWILEFG